MELLILTPTQPGNSTCSMPFKSIPLSELLLLLPQLSVLEGHMELVLGGT